MNDLDRPQAAKKTQKNCEQSLKKGLKTGCFCDQGLKRSLKIGQICEQAFRLQAIELK